MSYISLHFLLCPKHLNTQIITVNLIFESLFHSQVLSPNITFWNEKMWLFQWVYRSTGRGIRSTGRVPLCMNLFPAETRSTYWVGPFDRLKTLLPKIVFYHLRAFSELWIWSMWSFWSPWTPIYTQNLTIPRMWMGVAFYYLTQMIIKRRA